MDLHAMHIELVEAVNNARNEAEHSTREIYLRGWRDGVEALGMKVDLFAADRHYLDQGIDRPMCCGVWLDWKPESHCTDERMCVPCFTGIGRCKNE